MLGFQCGVARPLSRAPSERVHIPFVKRLLSISHIPGHLWPGPQEPLFVCDGRSRSDTEVRYGDVLRQKPLS
jgi:hypothetical protein